MMPLTIDDDAARGGGGAPPPRDGGGGGPLRQNLFASPIVSALYEKVLPPLWEAGLRVGGPDAEYESAARHLDGRVNNGSNGSNGDGDGGGTRGSRCALDLSCGTGFVGRRMAASGKFDRVFALDRSSEMLGECLRAMAREDGGTAIAGAAGGGGGSGGSSLALIRGDAGCLPFRDDVLDAVHWGAAMHCVPDAERAMEEVHRVLKPGGRLYATTFLRPFPDVVFRFFTVPELEGLSMDAGFSSGNLSVERRGVYGIIRATK